MSISMYKRRNMLAVLEQIHVPGSFLLDTFVNGMETHDTRTIDIDVVRNGKKMAPFVSPVREGKVISKEGFKTLTHTIPYIKIKREWNPEQALTRRAGLTVYDGQTPQQFISSEMGKTLKEFDDMIFRREEWMAAQMIQTGKVVVSGEGQDWEINTGMATSHLPVLTGVDLWSASTADIQADLVNWAQKVYADSGLNATDAILGSEASAAMLRNEGFIGALDRRRIRRGEIDIQKLPKGVKYFGEDLESGLSLWGYNEGYYDEDTSSTKELIDPKKVVVIAKGLRFTRHYGMISEVDINFVGPRFPKTWVTEDPSTRWLMLQSSPAVINHQPDAVVCATVLA